MNAPPVLVMPGDVDDPESPSGGNAYDRRVLAELSGLGWTARTVAGTWPNPDAAARKRLEGTLAALPDGTHVLVDGLVACGVADVVVSHARRIRLHVLVHLPLAEETGLTPGEVKERDASESRVLRAARSVVVTSPWSARHLRERHGVAPERLAVAVPGTDPAPLAGGSAGGNRLLCVAAVTPRKGQDVLIAALARVAELDWECWLVGPTDRDRQYAREVRGAIHAHGLQDRVRVLGPQTGPAVASCYERADLAVLPSYTETFGMVVTEALARGLPVLTTTGGALPDTLGQVTQGAVPGILVPPGEVGALSDALRQWLTEPDTRRTLRRAAVQRRATLTGWEVTGRCIAAALDPTNST